MFPSWIYLVTYLAIVGSMFGYVVYQRLAWKIVIGTLRKRETSMAKILFHPNPIHVYNVDYSANGEVITTSLTLNPAFAGWYLFSAENQPVVVLVHPNNQKNVKLLYVGDEISLTRIWILPATMFILALFATWFLWEGFSSSLFHY